MRERALLLFAGLASCAHDTPSDALARYRAAVAAHDVEQIWSLSDASFRASYSKQELRELIANDPRAFEDAVARLSSPARETNESAEVELVTGSRVLLVREDGAWRVASGALELAGFETPERALETFFRAIDGKRWPLVRRAIPKRHANQYTSDSALEAYVEGAKGRIEAARAALGALAVVNGKKAEIVYAPGKGVTFELEEREWRIVDLE